MRQITAVTVVITLLAVFFVGCKGPAGDTGPQGPQGPAGPAGPAGTNIPTISSVIAVPPTAAIGDTVMLKVYVAYAGTDSLTYDWHADEGTFLTTDDTVAYWISPVASGAYFVEITVSAGTLTVSGGVSVLTTETGEQATIFDGYVTSGGALSDAYVFTEPSNYTITDDVGYYSLWGVGQQNLSFYKSGYGAFTLYGVEHGVDVPMREVNPDVEYHSATITLELMSPLVNDAYFIVGATSGQVSETMILSPGITETTVVLNGIPDGNWRLYSILNDLNDVYDGCSVDLDFSSGDQTDTLMMVNPKSKTLRLHLGLPSGGIVGYRVYAYIDSIGVPEAVPHGRAYINFVSPPGEEQLSDSISIAGDMVVNAMPAAINRYHMTLVAWDRDGNRMERTVRYISYLMDDISLRIDGEFPDISLDSITTDGRPAFSVWGTGDLLSVWIGQMDANGNPYTIWQGFSDHIGQIVFPETPVGIEILPAGTYFYKVCSWYAPGVDIDDNFDLHDYTLGKGWSLPDSVSGSRQIFTAF